VAAAADKGGIPAGIHISVRLFEYMIVGVE